MKPRWFIVGLLCAAVPVRAQELDNRKDWPVTLSSPHYEIRSTAAREQALKLINHMELIFVTYTKLLALARVPTRRFVIVLFKDEPEYQSHGETPSGSAAYYDGRHLVGYWHEKKVFNYFAHEGFHQFTDIALKDIERAPMWFTEGMAECIGNHVLKDKKIYMCVKEGVICRENLPIIYEAVTSGKFTPLKTLLTMDHGAFMRKAHLHYPQAWSFCHFLLAAPQLEDPKNQIPNGKYWTVLSAFIHLMSKSTTKLEPALKASFVLKGKPIDLDELEKEWKEYVLRWGKEALKEDLPPDSP